MALKTWPKKDLTTVVSSLISPGEILWFKSGHGTQFTSSRNENMTPGAGKVTRCATGQGKNGHLHHIL